MTTVCLPEEVFQRSMDTHREATDAMRRAQSRMQELRHELGEANAEIDRHHRDFKRISRILDRLSDDIGATNSVTDMTVLTALALRDIRNIVG